MIQGEHATVELASGWTLETVLTQDGELTGFFAWIPEDLATPGNVTLAWLEYAGDGAWILSGWTDATAAQAVAAIDTSLSGSPSTAAINTYAIDASTLAYNGCNTTVVFDSPDQMPTGIVPTDPLATTTPEPTPEFLNSAAISGAAVAPGLSAALVASSGCFDSSELDVMLSQIAIQIAMMSDIEFLVNEDPTQALAVASCGGLCFPGTYNVWNGWSNWSCTPGGTPIAGASGSCGCRYNGCSRSRSGTKVYVNLFCVATAIGPVTETENQGNITCPASPPQTPTCPDQPNC